MRVRMTRRAAVAALVAVAVLVVGAAPASAAPGDASAHGAELDLSLLGRDAVSAGPFAAVHADGPTTGTFAAVELPDVLHAGVVTTSASRDDKTGAAASWASTADVRLDLLDTVTGGVSAELVEAQCAATQKGLMGKARFVGLDLDRLGEVDAEPAPNTALDVDPLGIARVVLNEQVRNADGSLTVNAVHVTLLGGVPGSLGSGDLVVSSATCGPAGLPIPMASGAGLWLGLGLLGLVALPAGAVVLLRQRGTAAV